MKQTAGLGLSLIVALASFGLFSSDTVPSEAQVALLTMGAAIALLVGLMLIDARDSLVMLMNSICVALIAIMSAMRGIEAANIGSNTSVVLYLTATTTVLLIALVLSGFGIVYRFLRRHSKEDGDS